MKSKENLYKGRRFKLTMNIGNSPFEYVGQVVESYGFLCLVEEKKAYVQGPFTTLGIYKIMLDADGHEQLTQVLINYNNSSDISSPPLYGAPEVDVRAKYEQMVRAQQLLESETQLKDAKKEKTDLARLQAEKLKTENFTFIKEKQAAIYGLRAQLEGKKVEKILSDKKIREVILDSLILEKIKTLIR